MGTLLSVRRLRPLGAVVPLLFVMACATVTVDRTRTAGVKRVAIAGFSVNQPNHKGLESLFSSSSGDMRNQNWGSGLGVTSPLADEMYDALEKQLARDLGWKVIDRKKVSGVAFYQQFYEDKMKGIQSRPPSQAGTTMLAATGIVDAWPVELGDVSKRRELIKKLGVDAIAVAEVKIELEKGGGLKMLVGAGDFFPKATVRFTVFDLKSEEPVWRDLAAVGEPVSEGVEHTFGISNKTALEKKMAGAAENSYKKLLERFRKI